MIKVINVISDTNIGGAGKILLSFLKNYDRTRFDIEVVLPEKSLICDELRRLNVDFCCIEDIEDKSFDIKAIKQLIGLFKIKKPDIVHTHAVMSARLAAKLYGKCRIVNTRHSVFDQPAYKKAFPIKQLLGLINNSLSDRIIAVSPAAADNIVETGADRKKIAIVFNGVDAAKRLPKDDAALIKKIYGINEDDFVCAIIARLEEVKGHKFVIDAAEYIQKADPKIKIIIAGTGSCESELKSQVRSQGITNVIFTGFIDNIWEIENIMDIQINASYGTEATSLSLLEGMSLGVPAIVSDFGGNPYVIENGINGLVIEKKNALLLRDAIFKLKNDKGLFSKLSEGALKIYNEKFTSQAMTAGIEHVYCELADKKGGR